MNNVDETWRRQFIMTFLEQVEYWHSRFESSRDVDDLDNAERNAEAIRDILPKAFYNLNLIGLRNLYWSLLDKTGPKEYVE